jgi:hypothetical protein
VSILGTLDAVLGRPSAENWANAIAPDPLYHGSALAIRRLERLWRGDARTAHRLEREAELWRLEQPRQQAGDMLTLLWSLQAHIASDDLTNTHHGVEAIEAMATQMRTWQPIAAWARGEYERIRGDHDAALSALDRALDGFEPDGIRYGRWQWRLASRSFATRTDATRRARRGKPH